MKKPKMIEEEFATELYKKHYKRIYNKAYSFFKNRHDSEDVTQEILIKILQNLPKFADAEKKGEKVLLALISETSKNVCCNIYAKKKREKVFSDNTFFSDGDTEDLAQKDFEDPCTSVEDAAIAKEELEITLKAIDQLPDHLRLPISLVFLEEYSKKEAARMLEISSTHLESSIHRAREKIREILDKGEKK